MRVLVGWDNPSEAETIELFLNVGDTEAKVYTSPKEFRDAAANEIWDIVLMALNFPSIEESYPLFEQIRHLQREVPILGACFQGEVVHLAKFVAHGLHNFITRDANGEFVFLLNSVIEGAREAVMAQRARQLAERLREEIESVRRLQESVIPQELPVMNGYEIAARYEPAQIRVLGSQPVVLAGGDYYDVFSLDSNTLILLVGDAAGHGIKACMSIMSMRTLIGMIRDRKYKDTASFVGEVNRGLSSKAIVQDEGGFITLLYCALDTARNRIEFTSAGHPMPLLQDLTTNEIRTLGTDEDSGLPLGISEDETYHVVTAEFPEHSRLLLYSDGLAEAFPLECKEYGQFGEQGIFASLRSSAHMSVHEAMEKLFADSSAFTGGSGRHDDTSLVLVQRTNNR
jgi:serine phosphatase RsbU (regulator of sigma subunit)/CheY-like chemotaxis protein